MGPRASLDGCGKTRLTGIQSPDRPARRGPLYSNTTLSRSTTKLYSNVNSILQLYIFLRKLLYRVLSRTCFCVGAVWSLQ